MFIASSADFIVSPRARTRLGTPSEPEEGRRVVDPPRERAGRANERAVPLAAGGQFSWPRVGRFLAAHGHYLVATNIPTAPTGRHTSPGKARRVRTARSNSGVCEYFGGTLEHPESSFGASRSTA